MKNRYGTSMTYGYIIPGSSRISQIPLLSKTAKDRLKWMDFYFTHDSNARLTCRHFGLSPDVFYRWKRRYDPLNLASLEDDKGSRRPKKVRTPKTDPVLKARIKSLREQYPRWGKKKLWKLLENEGFTTSVSTVGRTLTRLRQAGQLNEPAVVTRKLAGRRRKGITRPYAIRKPWGYQAKSPGDLIQVDTVHVYPVPGQRRYQFTSQDVVTKLTVRRASSKITASAAVRVIDALQEELPYPIKAIQIDGGSEFKSVFEMQCQARGIDLFVLPPRSPKLNGMVERMQRTSREEIYDLKAMPESIDELNQLLKHQDFIYNTIRPHDSLALMTPTEYCNIILTRN